VIPKQKVSQKDQVRREIKHESKHAVGGLELNKALDQLGLEDLSVVARVKLGVESAGLSSTN